MSNHTSKRKTVFIKKAFQGRFILNVFLVLLLSGACSAVIIHWFTESDLISQSQNAHVKITTALDNLGVSIFIGNLIALLIAGSITIFMVLYASHKIAGPLYRFEKLCQQIGDGNLDAVTKLREHDQLQDLGSAFSEMVAKLRLRKQNQMALVATLSEHLEQLQQDPVLAEKHTELLQQMQQVIVKLKE